MYTMAIYSLTMTKQYNWWLEGINARGEHSAGMTIRRFYRIDLHTRYATDIATNV